MYISKYIAKGMNLEKPKRLIIWNEVSYSSSVNSVFIIPQFQLMKNTLTIVSCKAGLSRYSLALAAAYD